jgi:CPA2 family monovalent cation:H+ antiporter-2
MQAWELLLDIVILLAASLALGTVMAWLRQSPLLGYLIAGMALGGPGSLQVVHSEQGIDAIAELGVALLLFGLGLEFSWGRLRALDTRVLVVGALQVVVTVLAGMGLSRVFGLGFVEAVVVGAMVSLSSTACVLRVLMDRGEIDSVHGRSSVGILLIQDVAVVPLALLVGLLGRSEGSAQEVAIYAATTVLFVVVLVGVLFAVSKVSVWVLGSLMVHRNRELGTLLAVVVGLGSAWAAHRTGTSPALGTFIAGMLLGSSPFAAQVRAEISSLRVVLLTLFFSAVGMLADPVWMARNALLVLGVVILVVTVKAGIVWLLVRLARRPHAQAIATGLCLAQIGEFAFVLGQLGREGGVLGQSTYMTIVSATIVSLFVSPYLVAIAPKAGLWFERRRTRRGLAGAGLDGSAASAGKGPDVLLIGLGPAGRSVADSLRSAATVTVVDLNSQAREVAAGLGFHCETGDASHPEILEHAGVGRARVVVITVPVPSAALEVIANVRVLAPVAQIVARSRYERYTKDYLAAGAHTVIDEEGHVGAALAAATRRELGLPPAEEPEARE